MKIECVWEHNGEDSLLYSCNQIGTFTRGESKDIALKKMTHEIISYGAWLGKSVASPIEIVIVQEKISNLNIKDADSDVLFDSERVGLTKEVYEN